MISTNTEAPVANVTNPLPSYVAATLENCTDDVHKLRKSYLPSLYGVIFCIGFLGNIMAMCVYTFKMRPWKSSTIIMFNLACTDLLYLIGLPFLIHYYANGEHWIFGDFLCKFIRFSFHFNLYSSILFLTCFSIFRYFAIVHPIRCFFVRKKSWVILACSASWLISLLAVSPVNYLITSKTHENKSVCLDLTSSDNMNVIRWYTWLLSSLAFFLPLITVTLCYTAIIYTLATGPHTQNRHKLKARKLVFLLLVVFYVCFLPFHVFRVIRIELRIYPVTCDVETHVHAVYVISRPLAAMNTCCNLLIYAVINDNFQQAIQSLLRCKSSNLLQPGGSSKSGILKL
ncbi:2-oxoglutarate receptor 1-like [Sceloporus undulatus]|uniref:2-oxoglutarate receptor 1-like n=1 Tax=Sceloporus undulatus TaxID=8520 RepID=UPI001C4BC57C|nr:2-oxoglutarate receptor 1-like [Sceloporus undulatus]